MNNIKKIKDSLPIVVENLNESYFQKFPSTASKTGLPLFDNALYGFEKSEIIVFAGHKSTLRQKLYTTLASYMSINTKILFVELNNLKTANVFKIFSNVLGNKSANPFLEIKKPNFNYMHYIRSDFDKLTDFIISKENEFEIVFIDSYQNFNKTYCKDEYYYENQIKIAKLKNIAKKINKPIVINIDFLETNVKTKNNIFILPAWCDCIYENSDKFVLIKKMSMQNQYLNISNLEVIKNRYGKLVDFDFAYDTFTNKFLKCDRKYLDRFSSMD